MSAVAAPATTSLVDVDVCTRCAVVWFDQGEREAAPKTVVAAAREPELPQEAREMLALEKIKRIKERAEAASANGPAGPTSGWQVLPAVLGFPVECDAPTTARAPLLTWAVSAVCVGLFVLLIGEGVPEAAARGWGFVPAAFARKGMLTAVSSFFLHAGFLHVLGNVYFLMVFGDNVEDELGPRRMALLLVLAHAAGLALHSAFEPVPSRPLIGASAGISGVIAYYAVAFPRAKLGFMWRYFFCFRWVTVSAWGAFAIWVALQFLGAWQQVSGFSNVSALGHLGGAAVGFAWALRSGTGRAWGRGCAARGSLSSEDKSD